MVDETNDDEIFSMDDLEKDLKKTRGARRLPWFGAGLVLGIAGTIFVPVLLAQYLPSVFQSDREILTGPVMAEELDGDRLLLTVHAEPGAFIASFTERVSEISMLVEVGDTVSLAVSDYEPFIENPDFEGVRKGTPGAATGDPRETARPDTGSAAETDPASGFEEGAPDEASGEATPPDSTASEGLPPDAASGSGSGG